MAEPLRYTRFTDVGFGNRLADARNLMHTQAPRVPILAHQESRTAVGSVGSEVANSIRQAALIPPGSPKHGWEKGSYRSPFDYHIASHTVGSRSTASVRSFSLASLSTPQGGMTPAHNYAAREASMHRLEPQPESPPSCRTVTPGSDAKERHLLLGPLRMICKTGVALCREDCERLFSFIDSYMSDSLHTVVERDGILPNVVYRVSIPMTDANWAKYNQLLDVFGFARGMHAMLAVGSSEFDDYTYVVDGTSAEHVEGWKVLASASERDLDMAILSQELVQVWKGMWIVCGAGYAGTVEDSKQ
ncbi:hypothetical protein G6011_01772 [Alternaria panax]|uniref:Uncharacterized protein n=1 Tax=Alternaria panax TaxID=48097 RepID=A0AAD4ILI1_9PLEO|nr:hypothetical protein G6011_01772 [Alternaria panax]